MSNKFTFFILNNSGAPVKQTTISTKFICCVILMLFGLAGLTGYVGYDYYTLKYTEKNPWVLQEKIDRQQSEIAQKNDQITKYAQEINGLKGRLLTLNDFEKKLRVIANIKKNSDFQDSIFGVGGAIPENIETEMADNESHSSLIREMHQQIDQIEQAAYKQEEGFTALYESLKEQRNVLASTPAIRPTNGWLSSRFGYRISPFTGKKSLHKGLDIANRKGTGIVATADGVVTFAGRNGNMGNTVTIDHGHGMLTRYGHLSEIIAKKGATVKRGDKIALMGNTGRSTGPHVHYEVKLNGIPVNPERYILD